MKKIRKVNRSHYTEKTQAERLKFALKVAKTTIGNADLGAVQEAADKVQKTADAFGIATTNYASTGSKIDAATKKVALLNFDSALNIFSSYINIAAKEEDTEELGIAYIESTGMVCRVYQAPKNTPFPKPIKPDPPYNFTAMTTLRDGVVEVELELPDWTQVAFVRLEWRLKDSTVYKEGSHILEITGEKVKGWARNLPSLSEVYIRAFIVNKQDERSEPSNEILVKVL